MDLRIPDVGLSTSLPRAILVHFVRDIVVGLSRLPSPLPLSHREREFTPIKMESSLSNAASTPLPLGGAGERAADLDNHYSQDAAAERRKMIDGAAA